MAESEYERVWKDYYLGVQSEFYFAQCVAMGALPFLMSFLGYYLSKHSPVSEFQE